MNIKECKSLDVLRKIASKGGFSCCKECPRHPSHGNPVFAEGCVIHQTENSPLILFVARDPSSPQRRGVVGCSTDGRVCPWCHTDVSANIFREKLYPLIEEAFPQMKANREGRYPVYCINAVLHGPKRNSPPPTKAIKACSYILKTYVCLLQPKLVVALGVDARLALEYAFDLKGLKESSFPIVYNGISFWWCYHPSGRSFNIRQKEIRERFKQIGKYLKQISQVL